MSEEILNEIEETQTETEIVKLPQRVNPFCVISKETFGEYAVRDIQTNSAWSENPYGEDYAVVPDDMVVSILETRGFCDITLNEDGTEVVSFTAREIPEIPQEEPGPTLEDRVATIEESIANSASAEEMWDEMALAIEEGVNDCE
jgi:hypothetical protein